MNDRPQSIPDVRKVIANNPDIHWGFGFDLWGKDEKAGSNAISDY